eukprot:6175286-Pleurochrysis_carterae.AAC.1
MQPELPTFAMTSHTHTAANSNLDRSWDIWIGFSLGSLHRMRRRKGAVIAENIALQQHSTQVIGRRGSFQVGTTGPRALLAGLDWARRASLIDRATAPSAP